MEENKIKESDIGSGIKKGLKLALCVITVLPVLYWLITALASNSMSEEEIKNGVDRSKNRIEEQGLELSDEYERIGFSEKSFSNAIKKLKPGELKMASVPGHAILLSKDKEGQVTVIDNGYFGGIFGHGQMLYSKALKDNDVNYVSISTGERSCGQAVINIASALVVDQETGKINFDKTAAALGTKAVKKSFGSEKEGAELLNKNLSQEAVKKESVAELTEQQSIEKKSSNNLAQFKEDRKDELKEIIDQISEQSDSGNQSENDSNIVNARSSRNSDARSI